MKIHRKFLMPLLILLALGFVIIVATSLFSMTAQAQPTDQNVTQKTSFKRLLDLNGDGTGAVSITNTFSITSPGTFFIQPPVTRTFVIAKTKIVIEDDTDFPTGGYGSIAAPGLVNGILFQVSDDNGVISDQLGGFAIKTNAQWGLACEIDFAELVSPGQGGDNNFLEIICLFAQPIVLNGARNERLELIFQDDMSPLISQSAMVDVFIR